MYKGDTIPLKYIKYPEVKQQMQSTYIVIRELFYDNLIVFSLQFNYHTFNHIL